MILLSNPRVLSFHAMKEIKINKVNDDDYDEDDDDGCNDDLDEDKDHDKLVTLMATIESASK